MLNHRMPTATILLSKGKEEVLVITYYKHHLMLAYGLYGESKKNSEQITHNLVIHVIHADRPSYHRLSARLVLTFADKECRVV
jgi:hypothetical protein